MICACGVDLRLDDYVDACCPVCGTPATDRARKMATVWDYLTDSEHWFLLNPQYTITASSPDVLVVPSGLEQTARQLLATSTERRRNAQTVT